MNTFPAGTRVRVTDKYPVTTIATDPLDEAERGKVHTVVEFQEPYYQTQLAEVGGGDWKYLFLPEELEAV